MLLFMMILIFMFCWFKPISAELQNCSDYELSKVELCLTGNGEYLPPFPVTVHIDVYLREIVDVDIEKNSITTRLGLVTFWNDPKLALTNDSLK